MANNKSKKQLLNFINARKKGKHGSYELNYIKDKTLFSPASAQDKTEKQIVSVTTQDVSAIVKERLTKARGPRKERSHLKIFWECGYNNWSETEFKLFGYRSTNYQTQKCSVKMSAN